jgi:serine/threonine protein kinase
MGWLTSSRHVFGSKNTGKALKSGLNPQASHAGSGRDSPRFNMHSQAGSAKGTSNDDSSEASESDDGEWDRIHVEVVAKISTHALREERAYHICKNLSRSVDPHGDHIVRPVDLLRLSSQQGDKGPIVVAIFESAGNNALLKYMDFGPAWYRSGNFKDDEQAGEQYTLIEPIPLPTFLDFAIGATECLEILHHGQRIVHGEIRGDAFHFNEELGQVKLINFGSGLRSFEHGLTSSGWSALSKEAGAKTKLSYISPEQTGRMPAEPDSRTDIYSLGILFWTLLTQQPAFDGSTPMDIIQGVLGRRLPSVSSVRLDVPDVIGNIVSKMTAKSISERYHSASGLRHDLIEVQKLLGDGDSAALKNWKIATKDVSSFFILPNVMIGRSKEHDEIVKVIDKVSKRHIIGQKQGVYSLSSGSSLLDAADVSSHSGSSSRDERRDLGPVIGHEPSDLKTATRNSSFLVTTSATSSQHNSHDSQDSVHSFTQLRPWERNNAISYESRGSMDSSGVEGDGARSSSDGVGSLTSQKNHPKFRRQGRCEVISIAGVAGLGKSCLVQSVQVEARRRGYFASSKFDQARSTTFGPVLKLLSSLFKQVFSESDTDTPFHRLLKQYVRPAWPMLSKVLGLPEFLLGSSSSYLRGQLSAGADRSSLSVYSKNQSSKQMGKNPSPGYNKSIGADHSQRDSSPTSSRGSLYSMSLGAQSSHDFLLSGSSTKSMRLMNTFLDVLRTFAQHKFICFCLDDLQFADPESLELIAQIISSKIKMVIICTYRPDEMLPERIKDILEPPDSEGISGFCYFLRLLTHLPCK